jgi:hypothetical protein
LRAASSEYKQNMEQSLRDKFDCKESIFPPHTFTCWKLIRLRRDLLLLCRPISKLDLPSIATFKEYRRLRAKHLWVANARPDISAFVSMDGSVTEEIFEPKHVQKINQHVQYLLSTSYVSLSFPNLNAEYLHMVVYADDSHSSREDGTSQLGYLICLSDKTKRVCVVNYRSCKSWRVARSSMAAKTLAVSTSLMRHLLCVTN